MALMGHRTIDLHRRHASGAVLALIITAIVAVPEPARAQETNLALGKTVARSSDCSCGRATAAVDGNPATFWQPLSGDRTDDRNVWLRVDLGAPSALEYAVLKFRTGTADIVEFRIRTSDDDASWHTAYSKHRDSGTINAAETATFPSVTARYVRIDFTLGTGSPNFQLNEFEVYATAPPPVLASVRLEDTAGRIYEPAETVSLAIGATLRLVVKGTMSNGAPADLGHASIAFASTKPAIARIDAAGLIETVGAGVTKITASVTLDDVTREVALWIDVENPTLLIADLRLAHPTMTAQIGSPALVAPGSEYPVLHARAHVDVSLSGILVLQDGEPVFSFPPVALAAGEAAELRIPGTADRAGLYELRLTLRPAAAPAAYDAFSFTVLDPADVPPGQSLVAHLGTNARLRYVPDYKGNRIIDFSSSGYGGGGVRLPDVQARVAVEPGDGDDSARIQAAIDEVSALPQNAEGIRGAVLLKRGRFEVGTTLQIRASGVVLRGEGQDASGTVLFATGTTRRDVLFAGGTAGRVLLGAGTPIADLYAPSGAHSVHVQDASAFRVGDRVVVRRNGNDRWIHYIGMDQIAERPGGAPGETSQWSPFALDFDRIITAIDGNVVTFDAPLANSVERRWGGGAVIKYDDPDRIEQVGIENLRVEVQFDPTVTATRGGQTYFADENHAVRFAVLDNVKNAWVRDVTTLHLEHSLVNVLRNAKWVTVQDSAAVDMVSLIDGGRRYNFALAGQLTLVQRCHAETARHAFVVDSRVPGPNAFVDCDSVNEFATSEPHHRWSVGGVFDNARSDIAIQDRAWLGSGHGWAGANYVAWNTEGDLVAQQPPTAQNYAIGHVGRKVNPFVPNADDRRPRQDGYWEQFGAHVSPRSMYLQQLQDRSGPDALANIERTPVGGGALDAPLADDNLPLLEGIKVENHQLEGFSPTVFDYVLTLPAGTTDVPDVRPHDRRHFVDVIPARHPNGRTILIVRSRRDPAKSVRYNVRFMTPD
jgi:F5/8 type C domain/Bacterial Ig-like domain (group 2)